MSGKRRKPFPPPRKLAGGAKKEIGDNARACQLCDRRELRDPAEAADDWLIVPNLWGAIVGDPSQKKSPAMSAAVKPLGRLIAKAVQEHADAIAAAKGDKVVNEAKEKAIKDKIKHR